MAKRVFRSTVLRISVHPEGESPIYGECATWVGLVDEGGGPFVEITQPTEDGQNLRLEEDELLAVVDAAKRLLRGLDNG